MRLTYKQILSKKEFLPFFVYDYEAIRGQILKLKKCLPPAVKIFYSVKANPNIAILRIMKNFGLGAEIVSWGEFLAAKKAGFASGDILFAGAAKTKKDFENLTRQKTGIIGVESLFEARVLNDVAKRLGRRQDVIVRLTFGPPAGAGKAAGRQRLDEYGIPGGALRDAIAVFKKMKNISLRGVHIYRLSRIFQTGPLIEEAERTFSFLNDLEKSGDHLFEIVDIGGGFGSNFRNELPLPDYGKKLSELIGNYGMNDKKIFLELGRFLVSKSGAYVANVIEKRRLGKVKILIIDGLINNLVVIFNNEPSRHYPFTEQLDDYKIEVVSSRAINKRLLESAIINGQLSSRGDVFGRSLDCRIHLSQANPGDFIKISGVGSYGLTRGLSFFGSRPMAAEFLLINGKLELIRGKGRPEDFLRNQIIPKSLK